MKTSFLEVITKDNLSLPALFFEPEKTTKKAIIYLHGMMSNCFYSAERMNIYAKEFTSKNISFLALNNRGAGYIEYIRKKTSEFESEKIPLGSAYEKISDCVLDIEGSIEILKSMNYEEIYLVGHSTGANKVCVYNYYKKSNSISKFVLLGGGDDIGINYYNLGASKVQNYLTKINSQIKKGNGTKFAPQYMGFPVFSYNSLKELFDPESDYNIFPFYEFLFKKSITKKEKFRELKSCQKETLIVYGENDEFCFNNVSKCIEIMKDQTNKKKNFEYTIIEDADHSFTGKELILAKTISNWLTK